MDVVRRAADDRAAILDIVASLQKPDRELLPDLVPTVNALVDRVAHLAQMLHRLDQSIDPQQMGELDSRIESASTDSESTDGQRRLSFLKRQRATLDAVTQLTISSCTHTCRVQYAIRHFRHGR